MDPLDEQLLALAAYHSGIAAAYETYITQMNRLGDPQQDIAAKHEEADRHRDWAELITNLIK